MNDSTAEAVAKRDALVSSFVKTGTSEPKKDPPKRPIRTPEEKSGNSDEPEQRRRPRTQKRSTASTAVEVKPKTVSRGKIQKTIRFNLHTIDRLEDFIARETEERGESQGVQAIVNEALDEWLAKRDR